ncbi:hypothetical protein RclHR1_18180005 [Rhizophagus clarus]|uniref:Myb-like domain-containing protein n=1 Tax=Rhizophagus clarus TaxID=94130 RepID=A0A2Z6R0D0_9GLOM|nr:hypothetical protein RclHR1_18180005 [Rhizophagus clarus]
MSGLSNEKEHSAKTDKSNKKKACNWNENAVKLLLLFLIKRKEEVNNLSTKRGGSSNTKCANKWKNIKKNYKDDMDHNKQSGNDPIEVQFKEEVEEILDENRSSITPKVLDSSLNLDDLNNDEEKVLFNEITGRNKRKNESDSIHEEKPQKAPKSEIQRVKNLLEDLMYQRMEDQEYKREERKRRKIERKQREKQRQREFSLLITALHSSNNIALPQTNHVPFYQSI